MQNEKQVETTIGGYLGVIILIISINIINSLTIFDLIYLVVVCCCFLKFILIVKQNKKR